MAELKSLAKDTAIYGASSIIGKFLNYLLVPVYTISLPASSGGYGVITNMYAIVALLLVLLTFGMETGFFRFANKGDDDPNRVYSTSLLMVSSVSLTFLLLCLLFLSPIADLFGYGEHPWYLGMMLIVIAMDAIQAIPFAYLRYKKRPIKFAGLKLLFIFISISLNITYFVVLKGTDVGAAFLINLICSFTVMMGLIPEFRAFRYCIDRSLMKRMLYYSFPMLILGIAGILNQVADKIIFPFVYPDEAEAAVQLGMKTRSAPFSSHSSQWQSMRCSRSTVAITASWRYCLSTAPECAVCPMQRTLRWRTLPRMPVTMPTRSVSELSSVGPCSMCSSTKASILEFSQREEVGVDILIC